MLTMLFAIPYCLFLSLLTSKATSKAVHAWTYQSCAVCMQACRSGELLVSLPRTCQLSYDGSTEPNLLQLISKVPEELWGAKVALRVNSPLPMSPFH